MFLLDADPERLAGHFAGDHDGLRGRVTNDTNEPVPMKSAPNEKQREAAHIERDDRENATAGRSEGQVTSTGLVHCTQTEDSIGYADGTYDRRKPAAK